MSALVVCHEAQVNAPRHQCIRQTREASRDERAIIKRSQRAPQLEHLKISRVPRAAVVLALPLNAACGQTVAGLSNKASHSSHVRTVVPLLWPARYFGMGPSVALFVDKASNGGFGPSRHIDRKAAASLRRNGLRA